MPEIVGETWFNVNHPITPEELEGRIVLVDFFTYSCVNCLNTLPYIKRWWKRYKHLPFFVIGIHTPEFEFEKNEENVRKALAELGVDWPVVLDNDYVNWHNFANHYWPAKYVFDQTGRLAYEYFGEGNYRETEAKIQELLKTELGDKNLPELAKEKGGEGSFCFIPTPETYLGYKRGKVVNSEGLHEDHLGHYTLPDKIPLNTVALEGDYNSDAEFIESFTTGSKIYINFIATEVNLVLAPATDELAVVEVLLNGKKISKENAGRDLSESDVVIAAPRMYNLVKSKTPVQSILTVAAKGDNFRAYVFTFSGCG